MRARSVLVIGSVFAAGLVMAACGDDGPADPAPAVEGVEWRLTEITGAEIADDAHPTLLLAEGVASGSGGCNTFTGPYTLDGADLSFGALATTRMACVPDVSDTEAAYLAALAEVAAVDVTDDALTLLDDAGETVLVYSTV